MCGEERDDWALADIGKRLMGGAVVVGRAVAGGREAERGVPKVEGVEIEQHGAVVHWVVGCSPVHDPGLI